MVSEQKTASSSRTSGSQTLARGLAILRHVAESPEGLSIAEVAELAGIHRTIAYRVVNTLCDARLVHRGADGRFRGAAGLLTLAAAGHQHLRSVAMPLLRTAATDLGSTISLLIRESDSAVAIAVVSPQNGSYHVVFSEGSRHPIDRGAAGLALLAAEPEQPGDSSRVKQVRADGFAHTFAEVEPNMHGLAVPLNLGPGQPVACLNVITVQEQQASSALQPLQQVAQELAVRLNQ